MGNNITEIEKQFFDTFGIEPITKNISCSECEFNLEECGCFYGNRQIYPQITDRILLELICLHNIYVWGVHSNTVNELKNILLEKYIEHVNLMADENEKQEYIHQVQEVFMENN